MSRLRTVRVYCLSTVVFACASAVSWAQSPMEVGEKFVINVDSGQPSDVAAAETVQGSRYVITHVGATYIALHFDKFDLAAGDALIVSDPLGGQAYTLKGKGKMDAGRFWSQHVKGDTTVLGFVTKRKNPGRGFRIDQYAAGFVDLGGPVIEQICGPNDFENAVCRQPSIEYDRGRAVARLLIQGTSLCTGWLASSSDHLVTNEHCISTSLAALNTDYEFGAEAPTCGSANCQLCWPGTVFSGSTFIQDNPGLDYALVQLNGNPSATFGWLDIDNRQAVVGEQVYLVSYPAGRAKEFAYNSTGDVGGVGRVVSVTEPTCTGGTLEVGYWNDTQGGSSGSPVLAVSSQKVIALHHCHNFCATGGSPNRGVPIDLICAEICGLLGCTVNADCDDGLACNGVETCDALLGCQAGTPVNCNDGIACTVDSCVEPLGTCSNTPDNGLCNDGNACTTDVCNVPGGCANTPLTPCCGDGTCEAGEDCNTCPADCFSGGGGPAACGNGICESFNAENCKDCPEDCAGTRRGAFCCGDGQDGNNPVPCSDPRCTEGGFQCIDAPAPASCCGDGFCEGTEDNINCAVDCGPPGVCGDLVCGPGENQCNCAVDCGNPPANEVPNATCNDGSDNDCDGLTDCSDADCSADPACQPCLPDGSPCNVNADCCGDRCRDKKGSMICD